MYKIIKHILNFRLLYLILKYNLKLYTIMKTKLIIMSLFCIALFSCEKDEKIGKGTLSKNFFNAYIQAQDIEVYNSRSIAGLASAVATESNSFVLGFVGEYIGIGPEYQKLAIEHNDTNYNGYIVTPNDHITLSKNIEAISIKTLDDYNANYTAGSSLEDILLVSGASFNDFVSNHYQYPNPEPMGVTSYQNYLEYTRTSFKKLSKKELYMPFMQHQSFLDNNLLIFSGMLFELKEKPAQEKTRLELTVEFENGRKMSKEFILGL